MIEFLTSETATIALLAFISIGLPFIFARHHTYTAKKIQRGNSKAKQCSYVFIMIALWSSTLLVLGDFANTGIDFADLGLSMATDAWSIGCLAFSLLISVFYLSQIKKLKSNKEIQEKVRQDIQGSSDLDVVLPTNAKEYRLYNWTSVTAGITEEILFRGFLIWGFSLYTNIYLASLLALLSFVLGHLYQRTAANLIKVTLFGAVLTLPLLISGSIIPSIIMHVVIDLTSGAIAMIVLNRQQGNGPIDGETQAG